MNAAAERDSRFRRTVAAIALACLAIIGVTWAVTYERFYFERVGDIDEAIKRNDNLALAFEEHTVRTLKVVDQALRLLKLEYQLEGDRLASALLREVAQIDPETYTFFGVVNRHGVLIMSTGKFKPISVADRDYFAFHRQHSDATLKLWGKALGRITGRTEIQVSRRVDRPDGSFGGVVVAGINPDYFARFYRRVQLGQGGLVQLASTDGVVLARSTASGASAGQDLRSSTLLKHAAKADSGNFLSLGRLDGVVRYQSFRVLREVGLVLAVGTSEREVLAHSRERLLMYLVGSSAATLFVLLFGAGLIQALRRQHHAMEAALAGEERLLEAEAPYRATFDQAAIGIAHTAPDGRFLKVNRRFAAMLGYAEEELTRLNFADVSHPEDVEASRNQAGALLADPRTPHSIEFEKRYLRRDGTTLWTSLVVSLVRHPGGSPDYFLTLVQDITARKEAQERLEHQAHFDTLTDLPNRALLVDRLTQTLQQARRKGWSAAALFVDLDRFKNVNDTLGHDAGDLLLKQAAARLAATLRAGDTVARVGGDEFVVVLSELRDASDAARVAKKIIDAMALPFQLERHEIFVTASVGIAMFPGDATDGETLIKNADVAMFRAKERGRNTSQFYAATMNARAMEKLLLEADLRRAVERDELLLHFQPKANIATRKVEGFEALLRWQRAGNGLISPAVFIPLLEDSGMIVAVGEWIIRAACAQLRDWRRAGLEVIPVAVNVSAKQFLHGDLRAVVERALHDHGIEAGLLQIEITESAAMQDPERAVRVLGQLKALGIRIAIDDFGTGYSSLGYLKRFPIDLLKLDRSFVTGLPEDADDVSIARAVIGMAHSLGLEVVAEGVETEAQRAFLASNGCNQMQGYLFSRPMPAADCTGFMRTAPAGGGTAALAV